MAQKLIKHSMNPSISAKTIQPTSIINTFHKACVAFFGGQKNNLKTHTPTFHPIMNYLSCKL